MPRFSFRGFSQGSPVAITAAQGGDTASGSVPAWGAATGSFSIQPLTAGNITAPAGVWFDVTDIAGFAVGGPGLDEVYDPSFHEITWFWDFGDPGSFQSPQNMPPAWNDANVAHGRQVAHVFSAPGTYTVTLWAVDANGTTGTASVTIEVADADDIYPATRTVLYSADPAEDWSEAGAWPDAIRIADDMAALENAVQGSAIDMRVLFKRGQTINGVRINIGGGALGHVGTWGTGPKPVLTAGNEEIFEGRDAVKMRQMTFENLRFQGNWDSTTETGRVDPAPFYFWSNTNYCHCTYHALEFDGQGVAINPSLSKSDSDGSIIILSDLDITNWQNYANFNNPMNGAGTRLAIIGSRFVQHPDALHGGPKNGLWNNHGPLRIPTTERVYIACADLFSRTGWSKIGVHQADQPCLRLNTSSRGGVFYNIERVVAEGGNQIVQIIEANTQAFEEKPGNYLFDRLVLIATAKTTGPFAVVHAGGMTWRNIYGIVPAIEKFFDNQFNEAMKFADGVGAVDPANKAAPQAVYSSTFLNLRTDAQTPTNSQGTWLLQTGAEEFLTTTFENNLVLAPNFGTPVYGDGPVETAAAFPGVTPRYRGTRTNFDTESGTVPANIGPGGSFVVPFPAGTDLAYWQAIEATDTGHALIVTTDVKIGGSFERIMRTFDGDLSVAFEAAGVRLTNSSQVTWIAGEDYVLRLDRISMLPAMDATYASPATIPLPRPLSNSPAVGTAAGFIAPRDLLGETRGIPADRGAFRRA